MSSCPKCLAGNEMVFKRMKSDYVLVIDDDAAKQGGTLPKNIKQLTYPIYKSKGNIIPIVAVLSPENEKLLGGLCYKQISGDGGKAFKTLDAEVANEIANLPPAEETSPAPGTHVANHGMQDWTNSEGKTIRAEAVSRTGSSVKLRLQNGKTVDYPLDKLSEDSRKLVSDTLGDN
ncbi:hypothetical protein HZ994_07800 [Akkermansiaceae bacterium]|nr:hypothetical protein HZ994_07800 [Akkermansiaceae bacterium]